MEAAGQEDSRGPMCKLVQDLTCVLHRTGQRGIQVLPTTGPAAQEITQLLDLAGLGLDLPAETRDTGRKGCE